MSLLPPCPFPTALSLARLVPTFPMLEKEQVLQAIADNCFLSSSDFYVSSSLRFLSLKMLPDSSVVAQLPPVLQQLELFSVTNKADGVYPNKHIRSREQLQNTIMARISSKCCGTLDKWGITVPGKLGTATGGFPKIESDSLLLVFTANIQCRKIEPNRLTLQACLETKDLSGIVYRGAAGDRFYIKESPTLRSLGNTKGHQAGSGAFKVVEYQKKNIVDTNLAAKEIYIEKGKRPRKIKYGQACPILRGYQGLRPLTANEFERLMGWEVNSTAKGITPAGKEIEISKTQRQKMLGNGIIPQEITDICQQLKPILIGKETYL